MPLHHLHHSPPTRHASSYRFALVYTRTLFSSARNVPSARSPLRVMNMVSHYLLPLSTVFHFDPCMQKFGSAGNAIHLLLASDPTQHQRTEPVSCAHTLCTALCLHPCNWQGTSVQCTSGVSSRHWHCLHLPYPMFSKFLPPPLQYGKYKRGRLPVTVRCCNDFCVILGTKANVTSERHRSCSGRLSSPTPFLGCRATGCTHAHTLLPSLRTPSCRRCN